MVGYLDIVILDEFHNTLKIYDIKTSTQGWNKWHERKMRIKLNSYYYINNFIQNNTIIQ